MAILLVVLFPLAAWLDPHRRERQQREVADALAAKIRAEAARAAVPILMAKDGVTEITFKSLEFIPVIPVKHSDAEVAAFAPQAPSRIKTLDERHVRITGYLLPTRSDGRRVREFLILANQMSCCFGREPRFCDYILAHMEGGAAAPWLMDKPISFEGTLHVRDVYVNGYWSGLYSMDCTKIAGDTAPHRFSSK
jgi:hypothetical protein